VYIPSSINPPPHQRKNSNEEPDEGRIIPAKPKLASPHSSFEASPTKRREGARQYTNIFSNVIGTFGGKNNTELINTTQIIEIQLM
jgi:hypothetical protein